MPPGPTSAVPTLLIRAPQQLDPGLQPLCLNLASLPKPAARSLHLRHSLAEVNWHTLVSPKDTSVADASGYLCFIQPLQYRQSISSAGGEQVTYFS